MLFYRLIKRGKTNAGSVFSCLLLELPDMFRVQINAIERWIKFSSEVTVIASHPVYEGISKAKNNFSFQGSKVNFIGPTILTILNFTDSGVFNITYDWPGYNPLRKGELVLAEVKDGSMTRETKFVHLSEVAEFTDYPEFRKFETWGGFLEAIR